MLELVLAAAFPALAPFEQRIPLDARAPVIDLRIPLRDRNGRVRYTLACLGGADLSEVDRLSASTNISVVPEMMCLLNEGQRVVEGTLLAYDESAPWHSRGQFRWEELVGACGDYPEYGRVRHFRLRGFELTLAAENLRVDTRGLARFDFLVKVRPDASAKASRPESPGYLHPRGRCDVVLRGHETRMCRDANFSWEACKAQ